MANNDIEFDILVNSKPAEKSIKEVENAQNDLDKTVKSTSNSIKANWTAIGAVAAGIVTSMALLAKGSLDVERAMFGLNNEQRLYVEMASQRYAVDQEIVAGYVQTGKAARMTQEETAKMIDTAIALGRAYPNESTETFIDNLREFNATGKEAGFITDVLETHFKTTDLAAFSVAQKMAALDQVTKGVNAEFDKTKAAQFDKTLNTVEIATNNLGTAIGNLISKSGIAEWFSSAATKANEFTQSILRSTKALAEMNVMERNKERLSALTKIKEAEEGIERAKTNWIATSTVGEKAAIRLANQRLLILDRLDEAEKKQLADVKIAAEERAKIIQAETASIEKKAEVAVSSNKTAQAIILEDNKEALKENTAINDEYQRLYDSSIDRLTDSFVDFAMTGKSSFKDMANSMIADLLRIEVKAMLLQAMTGIFGGGLTSSLNTSIGLFHTGTPEVKHTGGNIGQLPSYHSGLRGDERVAKVQVGEAIINRSGAANNQEAIRQMNAGNNVRGGDNITTAEIKFEVMAIDSASFDRYLVNNRKTIESIISNSISSNGSVRKTIRQTI